MNHRHINDTSWSLAAIDSCLERGDEPDWRDLFGAVRSDRSLAERVVHVARSHDIPGASEMAMILIRRMWPELFTDVSAKGQ